jgi:hypothetical protein
VEPFSPRPRQFAATEFLSELSRACATFLVLVAKTVKSAAAPAQLGGVEFLFEAPRAAVVLRLEVGQGLPIICESDLCLIFACFACCLRQELEQDSDRDKQEEKQIIEMRCNHWLSAR